MLSSSHEKNLRLSLNSQHDCPLANTVRSTTTILFLLSAEYCLAMNVGHGSQSPDMFVSVYADVGVKLCCAPVVSRFALDSFTSVRVHCKCTSQGSNRPSALTLACHPVHTTSTARPEERVRKHSKSPWRNTRWDASTDHHLRLQGGRPSSASLACCPTWPVAKIQGRHGNATAPSKMLSCSDALLSKCSFRVWAV